MVPGCITCINYKMERQGSNGHHSVQKNNTWWHQTETFAALLTICARNSPQASDAELWCFLRSAPEQTVELKSLGWWLETPSCSLWRHCKTDLVYQYVYIYIYIDPIKCLYHILIQRIEIWYNGNKILPSEQADDDVASDFFYHIGCPQYVTGQLRMV